jgi:UDP-N-acetylmuramoylalanine--D-glutamate ligase
MLRTKASIIPTDWQLDGCSLVHNRDNAALALQTAGLFKIDGDAAKSVLAKWRSLKGRLEFVKKIKNIEFYNDTASVRPASTLMAIKSLAKDRNIVLILGGAKGHGDYKPLYEAIPLFVHTVVLLPGSGTLRERAAIQRIQESEIKSAPSIEEAVRIAVESAKKGDIVLFSPGFDAAGPDGSSRKERGERFVRAVRGM